MALGLVGVLPAIHVYIKGDNGNSASIASSTSQVCLQKVTETVHCSRQSPEVEEAKAWQLECTQQLGEAGPLVT